MEKRRLLYNVMLADLIVNSIKYNQASRPAYLADEVEISGKTDLNRWTTKPIVYNTAKVPRRT